MQFVEISDKANVGVLFPQCHIFCVEKSSQNILFCGKKVRSKAWCNIWVEKKAKRTPFLRLISKRFKLKTILVCIGIFCCSRIFCQCFCSNFLNSASTQAWLRKRKNFGSEFGGLSMFSKAGKWLAHCHVIVF